MSEDGMDLQAALDVAEEVTEYEDVPGWVVGRILAAYLNLREDHTKLQAMEQRARDIAERNDQDAPVARYILGEDEQP